MSSATNLGGSSAVAVTPDSFTVTDNNALAATDQYVDVLVQTRGQGNVFVSHNQRYTGAFSGSLVISDASKLWFISVRLPMTESVDTCTVKYDATPDGSSLRIVPARPRRILEESGVLFVKFVTNDGDTHFTTADGLDWFVEGVTEVSNPGWIVQYDEASGKMQADLTADFNGTVIAEDPYTGNQIQLNNNGVTAVDVYIDPADAEANRLNANFSTPGDRTVSLQAYTNNTLLGTVLIQPVYINPTAAQASRIQHNNAFLTDPIYIFSASTNEFVKVVYNANAATDGYRLRFKDGAGGSPGTFQYNTSVSPQTDTKFYTSTDLRPSQNVS